MLTFVNYPERSAIILYFVERFGIAEEAFHGFRLLKKGRTIWAVRDGAGLDNLLKQLRVEGAGIPLIRIRKNLQKPTTAGLRLCWATRNVIDLDGKDLEEFLNGGVVVKTFPAEPGYVAVRWKGEVLGCGLYSKGKLRSQIPKHWWPRVKGQIDTPEPQSPSDDEVGKEGSEVDPRTNES